MTNKPSTAAETPTWDGPQGHKANCAYVLGNTNLVGCTCGWTAYCDRKRGSIPAPSREELIEQITPENVHSEQWMPFEGERAGNAPKGKMIVRPNADIPAPSRAGQRKQYTHNVVCNGDRRKPPGTKGVSCSCFNSSDWKWGYMAGLIDGGMDETEVLKQYGSSEAATPAETGAEQFRLSRSHDFMKSLWWDDEKAEAYAAQATGRLREENERLKAANTFVRAEANWQRNHRAAAESERDELRAKLAEQEFALSALRAGRCHDCDHLLNRHQPHGYGGCDVLIGEGANTEYCPCNLDATEAATPGAERHTKEGKSE